LNVDFPIMTIKILKIINQVRFIHLSEYVINNIYIYTYVTNTNNNGCIIKYLSFRLILKIQNLFL